MKSANGPRTSPVGQASASTGVLGGNELGIRIDSSEVLIGRTGLRGRKLGSCAVRAAVPSICAGFVSLNNARFERHNLSRLQ